MLLIKLAWKNVWRKKSRSLITMSSIFCAVVLAVVTMSIQDGVFDNLVKNVVSFNAGYLQIHKNGYWEEQVLDNGLIANPAFEDSVLQIENIQLITPRLESFTLVASGEVTRGCLVSGIVPAKENAVTSLEEKLVDGAFLVSEDQALLVAEGLAAQLSSGVNDTLILIGQGYHGAMAVGKYPIRGIIRFGSPELNNQVIFMPLAAAQEFFASSGLITTYVLSLSSPRKLQETIDHLKSTISADYEVMSWEEIVPEISQHIKTDKASMYIIIGILYLLIVFGIFGTQLMMMVERRHEMGMMIAIGMTKPRLIGSIIIESVIMVFLGCLIGIGLSVPVVFYMNKHPIRFTGEEAAAYEQFGFEPVFPTSTEAVHFWSQGLIVLTIGLILSLYPIVRIVRLDLSEAMSRH